MFRVCLTECGENQYYNKKENAIKRAKELFNECLQNDYYTGTIEKYNELYGNYTKDIAEFETGNYMDDWVTIEEIETED